MDDEEPVPPAKGDQYEHPDGTLEVVFAVEGDRVLAIREYPSTETFEDGVEAGRFEGTHEGVASLPAAEYYSEMEKEEE